ncbi:MAG: nuclear transport factor 2 family protein [Acidobacteriota bacterium]|nr:nuclear transport factor 2 family protein [Acidobacteriota bacterium]
MAAIRATTDRWEAAVRAGNWEDAAATFTEDAVLRFANTVHEGRPAILKFHQAMPPWTPERSIHIDEIRGRGDMAFVMGHSTVTPSAGREPVVVGRYLDIRLRQPDGTWLFYRDMVSPVPPPSAPQVK